MIPHWLFMCPSVCHLSVRPYFSFWMIAWVNVNGFSPSLLCVWILWRSDLGSLMGKFRQFSTELFAFDRSLFLFPDDNFSKCQWIFTKLGVCIDIIEICFGIADGQISSIFVRLFSFFFFLHIRLETRRSRVQPPPRSATFFCGDWSWNIFYGHSFLFADSRRAVVSFWQKNVHNTG